jgi:hypothetical protein
VGESFTVLESLHRQSASHRPAIESASRCGCFYCQHTFAPVEILDWVDSGSTALCPRCGVDSVVPESAQFQLTPELLKDMRAYWFERSVSVPNRPKVWQTFVLKLQPLKRRLSWLFSRNRAA